MVRIVVLTISLASLCLINFCCTDLSKESVDMQSKLHKQNQFRISSENDYERLLIMGRKFLNEVQLEISKQGRFILWSKLAGWNKGSEYIRLPKEIEELNPTQVLVCKDYVRIEIRGALKTYGYIIFMKDDVPKYPSRKEVIKGLWYFEEK